MKTPTVLFISVLGILAALSYSRAATPETAPANPASASAPTGPITKTDAACARNENWTIGSDIPKEVYDDLKKSITGKLPPVRGFSEALALRRFAVAPVSKAFGEYFISRSLYESKLYHTAHEGFGALASKPVTPEIAGIQIGAIECLSKISEKFPTLKLSDALFQQLDKFFTYAESHKQKQVLWDIAGFYLRNYLNEGRSPEEIEKAISYLKGAGTAEFFAKGMWAAKRAKHQTAAVEFEKFLLASDPGILKKYRDAATMLLARSYYSSGDFAKAAATFKKIPKNSNMLAISLEELSWAHLQNGQYTDAVGNALALQSGGMRKTYAPEAVMVMAMALNEICQYPESVKAISSFKRNYESVYRWLLHFERNHKAGTSENFYPKAIAFVKGKTDVPVRIASEWIRSPLFTASQDEINLLFDEKDAAAKVEKVGGAETRRLSNEILKFALAIKPKYKVAKIKETSGTPMPASIIADVGALRQKVVQLLRLQQAAPVWKMVMQNSKNKVGLIQKDLIAGVNLDLTRRTLRMVRQLDEIAENIQLIEVEIYNGASQDIVWQNAHPEYRKIAQNMKTDEKGVAPEHVWNWGRAPAGEDDEGEIWEDELDSFKVDLFDNCSSKDKYLALRLNKR